MIDAFHRWCLFCHAEIRSEARSGPRVRLDDYVMDLLQRSADGKASRIYERENRVARIAEAQALRLPNGGAGVAMVITLGDRRGANPAFVHYGHGVSREAERLEGEVKGVSAHCLIELAEDPDHVGRHRMVIEEVRGIGRTPITDLLNSELRTISTDRDERFVSPDTGGKIQLRPRIQVWPQQSREMREALETGTFGMIELFDVGHVAAFDEQPEFKVQRRTLKVKVTPAKDGIRAALGRLSALGRAEGYGKMKVNWRLPGGDRGTMETRTDLADIGTALLSRRELVTVEAPMTECTHRLNDEFVHAMAAFFV